MKFSGGKEMDTNTILEKIELVKEKTGASYTEAKEALEKFEGNVVAAVEELQETIGRHYENLDSGEWKENPVVQKAMEIVKKGNISRIIVKKSDVQFMNIPLTVGIIGAIAIPWITIAGLVAAIGTQCSVEFVDTKGNIIDINGKVIGIYDQAKDLTMKGVDKAQELIKQGKEFVEEYKEKK